MKRNRSADTSDVQKSAQDSKQLSPEDLIKQVLKEKIQERQKKKQKITTPTPKPKRRTRARFLPTRFGALMTVSALLAGYAGFQWHTQALPYYQIVLNEFPEVQIELFAKANAEASTKKPAGVEAKTTEAAKETDKAKNSTANGEKKSADGAEKSTGVKSGKLAKGDEAKESDVRQWTTEEVSFFKNLSQRKEELDQRENDLNALEEELQKQKVALDERMKQLEAMRKQISQTLESRVTQDQEKVAKLVDFYSNMKPTQAAKVIETLNEDLAMTILDRMKKKNVAEIMNAMNAEKARKLSELLTGYETSKPTRSRASVGESTKEN